MRAVFSFWATRSPRPARLAPPSGIVLAVALLALLTVACAPPPPPQFRIGDDDPAEGEGEDGEGESAAEGEGEVGDEGEGEEGEGEEGEGEAGEGEGEAPDPGARELRGIWITRFAFSSEADLRSILDRAADAGFNAAFVQVRGNGDAYYASTIEPWAMGLSGGFLGRDPGWDPLAVAVEHGHARGLEVHAYVNALTGWPASLSLPPVAEGDKPHMLAAHPEWLVVDDAGNPADEEYYWVTPGNPEVRAHTAAVVRDILERYDVDGIHLDRIRSPGAQYSFDDVTVDAFAQSGIASRGDFMRRQVALVVSDIYDVLLEVRPEAKLSAAVWGIHTALPGCFTSEGSADYHQDSLAWVADGIIDALAPMTYWSIEDGACTDWAALLDGFMAADAGRHIWMGMHALDDNTFQFDQIEARIELARARGAQGTLVFASTYLDQGGGTARWDAFVEAGGPFVEPASVPELEHR